MPRPARVVGEDGDQLAAAQVLVDHEGGLARDADAAQRRAAAVAIVGVHARIDAHADRSLRSGELPFVLAWL
jgi:hypothetical protein